MKFHLYSYNKIYVYIHKLLIIYELIVHDVFIIYDLYKVEMVKISKLANPHPTLFAVDLRLKNSTYLKIRAGSMSKNLIYSKIEVSLNLYFLSYSTPLNPKFL